MSDFEKKVETDRQSAPVGPIHLIQATLPYSECWIPMDRLDMLREVTPSTMFFKTIGLSNDDDDIRACPYCWHRKPHPPTGAHDHT